MLEAHAIHRTITAPAAKPRRGLPSASAAIFAGLTAGVAALVLTQFIALTIYDESPWQIFRMLAAMVRGPGVLGPDDEYEAGIVAIGLALHFGLAMLYSLALSCVVAELPRAYAGITGVLCGIALYYANFYGFAALFPWFSSHRTVDTLAVHALFGFLVARGYWLFLPSADR